MPFAFSGSISKPWLDHRPNGRYHDAMTDRQNILVVEVEENTYDEIATVLTRNDFTVDRFPTAPAALELVTLVSFKAIIVNHPLKTIPLDDFLAQTKGPESASREALVGVFVSSTNRGSDLTVVPDGVDIVIGPFGGQSERDRQLCKLLDIEPRAAVRVKVNTEVTLVDHQDHRLVAQTKDLSTSGFFTVTNQLAPVGSITKVIFTFPGDQIPFVAEAEVVRHAAGPTGENQGMGLRFITFQDGHINRLGRFLESFYT